MNLEVWFLDYREQAQLAVRSGRDLNQLGVASRLPVQRSNCLAAPPPSLNDIRKEYEQCSFSFHIFQSCSNNYIIDQNCSSTYKQIVLAKVAME